LGDEPGRNNTLPQWAALVAQLAELSQRLAQLRELWPLHAQQFAELARFFDVRNWQFNPNVFNLNPSPPYKLPSLDLLSHAPAKSRKLTGKEWVKNAYERRADELHPDIMDITEAGRELSKESKTAPDCAKPLGEGHCTNLLRELNVWPKKPRNSPKQGPK
jgi:hypothetical protein